MNEHGTYENYRAAKARLFQSLEWTKEKPQGNPRLGIINHDDPKSFDFLNDLIKVNKVNYGLNGEADVHAGNVSYTPFGIRFEAVSKGFRVGISSNLVGAYNVSNCLAALCVAVYGLGIEPEIAAQGIAALDGIPGRMERIDMGQNFVTIVDFAHTPNALRRSLTVARTLTPGRVIAIFGCAGLRDVEKRVMMGHIAAELADLTLITAEDPRTENLDAIIAATAEAMLADGAIEGQTFERVPDRGRAIYRAVQLAGPNDMVIALGKGHEQSMCFGQIEYPWDDREAMRSALRGQPLLTLPTAEK